MMLTTDIVVGMKVCTHSLSSDEYNDLSGIVMGQPVERKGVMRVPVTLSMTNGTEKIMSLQMKNLKLQTEQKVRSEINTIITLIILQCIHFTN
jgi:hypothetical protein